MNDDYLSASQVAQIKGVSRNAVYKAIQEGRLASVRFVGVIGINKADVEVWTPKSRIGRLRGGRTTEEAKAKIAESQRKSWKQRKEDKN